MALFRPRHETWQLTQVPVVLSVPPRPKRRWRALLLCLLLLAAALLWARQHTGAAQMQAALHWLHARLPAAWQLSQLSQSPPAAGHEEAAGLREQIDSLQGEVQRLNLQNDIAQATRTQLEQQIAALQEELRAARLELDFVKQHQAPPANHAPARQRP